jgi:uroporphyrinogen-III synthase
VTVVGGSARLLTLAQIGDDHPERGTGSRLSYRTTIASSGPRTAALLLSQAFREP